MAVVADRVIVELEAKLDKYDARLRQAEQRFSKSMGSIERSTSRASSLVSTGMRTMAAALAGVSTIALARQFLAMTDASKKMDAQLRLATAGMGSFEQAQKDVQRIAELTRSDLTATAGLYAAFARGAKELGITQATVAEITETVGKAFKVSGTGAAESAMAIRQLTQAFQSGVLRGDEFNSIMENAPRLAKLLSDSLKISTGELRAMAEEGELTADKLTAAFSDRKFTAALNEEFKQIPVTFDDAMTLVYNSALVTFSEFDRGGGFSEMLVQFVTDGAAGFDDLGKSAHELGLDIRSSFAGLRDVFQPLLDGARAVFGEIGFESRSLADQVSATLGEIDAFANWMNPESSIDAFIDEKLWGIKYAPSNLQGRFDAGAAASRRNREAQLEGQREMDRRRDAAAAGTSGGGGSRSTGGRRGGGRSTRAARSPLDAEAFARDEARLNDEILREKQDAAMSLEAIADIELQRLQAEQAREAAETQASDKFTAEQKARLVALQGSVYALRRLNVVAERDAEIAERASEAAELAYEQRQNNARYEADALEARYRLAESSKERADIEARLLSLAEEQERVALEALIAAGRIKDAEAARADLAEMQGLRREGSARDNESPAQRYARELNKSADELGDQAEALMVEEIEHVRGRMRDAISDALGTDDPLITGLIDMLLEQLLFKPIAEALAANSAGAGGTFGSILSTVVGSLFGAPGRASGGHVQRGKYYRVTDGEGFVAPQSGKIVPLGRMRGAGGGGGLTLNQTVNVDASGSVNPEGYTEYIKAAVRQETIAIVGRGMKQTVAAVPGRMAEFERDGM
jgi:tape measure domain-containing protein